MARRNWSTAYKTEMLREYVRIVRKHGRSLTATGVDAIANRAHFLHQAQEKVCVDPELRRDIDIAFATMFLRNHKSIIDAVRPLIDLQLREEALKEGVEPNVPPEGIKIPVALTEDAQDKSTVGSVIANLKQGEEAVVDLETKGLQPDVQPETTVTIVRDNGGMVSETRNYPIVGMALQTIGVLDQVESLVHALRPLTEVQFGTLIENIRKAIADTEVAIASAPAAEPQEKIVEVEKIVHVPAPRSFVGRNAGELRVLFGELPSVIISGFSPVIIHTVVKKLVNIAAHVRNPSTLMQCVSEHPDASVLVITHDVKIGPRLAYLLDALDIQIIQVPNTKDDLEQVVAHLNGYTVVKTKPTEPLTKWPFPTESQNASEDKPVTNDSWSVSDEDDDSDENEDEDDEEDLFETSESDKKPELRLVQGLQPVSDQSVKTAPSPAVSQRHVVFITHQHSAMERNEIRLRFAETLDIRYCDAYNLDSTLAGQQAPSIIHYASIAPMQAQDVIKRIKAELIYTRSAYLDVFGRLVEIEKAVLARKAANT